MTHPTAQLLNAIAAAQAGKGRAQWVVSSSYVSPSAMSKSVPMTHREALAHARIVRKGGGWASVERA